MDLVNLLSMGTTVLCIFLKIPQILTVIKTSSVHGLSRPSLMLEFWSYSTTLSYSMFFGYSFKMYSEYFPLLLGDLILFLLMIRSDREQITLKKLDSPSRLTNGHVSPLPSNGSNINFLKIFIPITIAIHTMIAMRFFPRSIPILAIAISSPIGIVSKMLQLWEIVSNKSAGSVSAMSWFLNFISTFCRLISVVLTVKDLAIISSLSVSAILNIAVSISARHYSNRVRKLGVDRNDNPIQGNETSSNKKND